MISRIYASTIVIVALALTSGACSRLPQGALVPVAQASTARTAIVPILVATTRNRAVNDVGDMFGSERADRVSYASIKVSLPPDTVRKIGDVQWPKTLPGDPARDFVTVSADYLDHQSFSGALSNAIKHSDSNKVLIFVHGFNNRFDEAVYRFAQIAHDSKAPAVPVLFSWPSRGVVGLAAYHDDMQNATSSRAALEQLFDTIAANQNVKEVNVLCHSMGCLLTLQALHAKALNAASIGDKIANVLLVAPDVDVNVFQKQMRQMGHSMPRFALFLSQDDHALKVSKAISGGQTRLGDIDPAREPYKSEFRHQHILVFDLTGLRGGAHSRAFEDVTSVMGMIEARLAHGQQMDEEATVAEAAQ